VEPNDDLRKTLNELDTSRDACLGLMICSVLLGTSPEDSYILYMKAKCLYELGRNSEALTVLNSIKNVPLGREWYVEELRGLASESLGRFADAERYYRVACEKCRETPPVVFLGALLFRMERFDDAISVLRGAVDMPGDPDEVLFNLGNCFRAQGKLQEARGYYQQAITLDGNLEEYSLRLQEIDKALAFVAVNQLGAPIPPTPTG
jgi:tetratricopeptide (TPR) repeat protein